MDATDRLMTQVLEVHGEGDLAGGSALSYVNRQGDAFLLAGGHTGWAWCWCYPRVTMVPTHCRHGQHPQVTHRRVADMTDTAYDEVLRERGQRELWIVSHEDGQVFPGGQDPA